MYRRLAILALAIPFVLLVSTTRVEAQLLDGMWVKLTINAAGVSYDEATNTIGKRIAFKGTCYMLITWNAADMKHEGRVVCQWADGFWYETSLFVFDELSNGDFWGWDQWGVFYNGTDHYIWGWVHLFVKPVLKKGILKKIQLTSLGRVTDGNIFGTSTWGPYGPYSVKGAVVPESKVPPEVVALLNP